MAITEARPEAAADAAHGIGPRRHPIAAWLTTTDHKKIGIMYLVNSYFWFGVAGLLAVFIRAELAQPGTQYFGEERYNQLFTMHGTTMIFLFIIPILAGFGNYIVPLQIGALDMAFPRVNALSFWMLPLAGLVLYSSYAAGRPGRRRLDPVRPAVGGGRRPGQLDRHRPVDRRPAAGRDQPPSWARSTSSPPSSTCGRRA